MEKRQPSNETKTETPFSVLVEHIRKLPSFSFDSFTKETGASRQSIYAWAAGTIPSPQSQQNLRRYIRANEEAWRKYINEQISLEELVNAPKDNLGPSSHIDVLRSFEGLSPKEKELFMHDALAMILRQKSEPEEETPVKRTVTMDDETAQRLATWLLISRSIKQWEPEPGPQTDLIEGLLECAFPVVCWADIAHFLLKLKSFAPYPMAVDPPTLHTREDEDEIAAMLGVEFDPFD